jgi:hypothetical protein
MNPAQRRGLPCLAIHPLTFDERGHGESVTPTASVGQR